MTAPDQGIPRTESGPPAGRLADRASAAGSSVPRITPWVYSAFRVSLRAYFGLAHRLSVRGTEHVPRAGGVLIVSNHASFLDPPLLGTALRHRNIHFMARHTLFQNPLTRAWARAVGVVPMDRDKGDIRALRDALALVQAGGVLCVFPEGTRTSDGRLQPAKAGVGFLVEKSGVPVVPVHLDGTFAALPRNARRLRLARITVSFGPPIRLDDYPNLGKGPERRQRLAELVMARIAALGPTVEAGRAST